MSWKHLTGYYVYTYFDENQIPYYVGMGQGKRVVAKHLYVRVPDFSQIVIVDNLTALEAYSKEIELIAKYGRKNIGTGTLLNLTNGGPTQKSGWNQSKEAKQKISEANTGKIRTAQQRLNYSKPKSAEHANKIRLANTGRPDDGRYAKISETMKLKKWYTDGIESRMFIPGNELDGYVPGRKLKEKQHELA